MDKKHHKFVSILEAVKEVKNTLLMQSELKQREEIMPLLNRLEEFEIRKGTIKIHPLDFVKRNGLWIRFRGSENFYFGSDLVELLIDRLSLKQTDTISGVYSAIHWVKSSVANHPETGVIGLLIETEMEKFKCIQCGHCCLDLPAARGGEREAG